MAGGDVVDQIIAVSDLATIDRDDNVTGLNSGFGGSASRCDGTDENSVREAVHATDRGVESRLETDADGAANDFMFGSDEHVVDTCDGVGGHGETDALRAHGLRINGGVHADNVACHVDKRATGVAGIDSGIGLDEALELALRNAVGAGLIDGAVLGGDDSRRDCFGQSKWAADSEYPVAYLSAFGVAKLDGGKGILRVNLNDGDVCVPVDADYRGGTAIVAGATIRIGRKLDVDLVGFVDDVIVGNDVATGIYDEARAESSAFATLTIAVIIAAATLAAEEAIEEILHVSWLLLVVVTAVRVVGTERAALSAAMATAGHRLLGHRLCVDVDDCGANLFDDLREAVGERCGGGNDERLRVGGVEGLLLFATDTMSQDRTGDDANREGGKEGERSGKATAANAIDQARRSGCRCVHRKI